MINVVFTREKKPDFVSYLIMKFLRTEYSHVFFELDSQIFHATGKGVHQAPFSEYMNTHVVTEKFTVSLSCSEKEFLMFMEGAKGKEYSQSQYLGFFGKFMQRFVKNGDEKMICSELVAIVLQRWGGFKLPKDADFMSPKDVYQLLSGAN